MPVPKRRRMFQLECLEDRKLLSGAKAEPFRGSATGTFHNVQVSVKPLVDNTTINGAGSTATLGQITVVAHNTTTVTTHGKKSTVSFTHGTGTMTDALGDTLFFSYSGKGPLTSATSFKINETGMITGGTGLAAGAKGHFTGVVTGDFTSDTITITVNGKVTP